MTRPVPKTLHETGRGVCGGDPVNGSDPTGLFNEDELFNAFVDKYGEEGLSLLAWVRRNKWGVTITPGARLGTGRTAQGTIEVNMNKLEYAHWYSLTYTESEKTAEEGAEQLHYEIMRHYGPWASQVHERRELSNELKYNTSDYDRGVAVYVNHALGGFGFKHLNEAANEVDFASDEQTTWERVKKGAMGSAELIGTATMAGDGLSRLSVVTDVETESALMGAQKFKGGVFEDPFPGGLNGAKNHFTSILEKEYAKAGEEFEGLTQYRDTETQFLEIDNIINFQREAHITKGTVAEEVQHALDKVVSGATEQGVRNAGRLEGIGGVGAQGDALNAWWHRRVFTRLLQNVNDGKFGLEYLRPHMAEIYQKYQSIGGKLSLPDLLKAKFKGPY